MKFKIVESRKIFFIISAILIIIGIASLAIRGLNLGIDFRGGTIATVDLGEKATTEDLVAIAQNAGAKDVQVQFAEGNTAIIRFYTPEDLDISTVRESITDGLSDKYSKMPDIPSYETVSATASRELINAAIVTVALAAVFMLIYIWIRFELHAGIAALIGLLHDIFITVAVMSLLQVQLNSVFIAALLTLFGYTINNTIIIFDRIRENNKTMDIKTVSRATVVDASVRQSLTRTLFSSLTTLLTIVTLYIIGVTSIKEFTLPIIVGILVSLYTSTCLNPCMWELLFTKRKSQAKTVKKA